MSLTDEKRTQMTEYYLKDAPCPKCNSSENVVRVVVGRPTPELQEFVKENPSKIELGGCGAEQTDDGKLVTHKCTACNNKYNA